MEKSIIVYGSKDGSDAVFISEALKHFKLNRLIQGASPGCAIPKHGALILTSVTPPEMHKLTIAFFENRIYSIEQIKELLHKPKGV